MAKAILVFLLLCIVGVGCWMGAKAITRDNWQAEIEQLKDEIRALQDKGQDNTTSTPNPELTFAEKREAIISFSKELLPIYESIGEAYSDSLGSGGLWGNWGIIIYDKGSEDYHRGRYMKIYTKLVILRSQLSDLVCEDDEMASIKTALKSGLDRHLRLMGLTMFYYTEREHGLVEIRNPGAWEKQKETYKANKAGVEASYNSAYETWQSVLNKYNILPADIGLSRPLSKFGE